MGATEQLDQLVEYYYETNPFDGTYTQNANGRLAAVQLLARRKGNVSVAGETREFNLLGLPRIVAGSYDFRYNFSATANDGRVTSQSSYLSGVCPAGHLLYSSDRAHPLQFFPPEPGRQL